MTEELEQKAEEYLLNKYSIVNVDGHYDEVSITHRAEQIKQMLVEFANEATKELQEELEEREKDLIEQLEFFEDACVEKNSKIAKLEKRIEKMKCCYNCYRFNGCSLQRPCRNYEDWKLKEAENA